MIDIDLDAIKTAVDAAESFSSLIWPAGEGWKQIGLCFDNATDPQVIFTLDAKHLDQWRAILDHGHHLPALLARLAEVEAERDRLREHILDIDAHATPYGDVPEDPGYVGTYLLTAGALHRALGKIGHSAPNCQAEAERDSYRDAIKRYDAVHDNLAAENARLRQQRDAAVRQRDERVAKLVDAEHDLDATNQALKDVTDLLDEARRQRDSLNSLLLETEERSESWSRQAYDARAEVKSMRPVVEAAEAWRDEALAEPFVEDRVLYAAVDAYRAGQKAPAAAPASTLPREDGEVEGPATDTVQAQRGALSFGDHFRAIVKSPAPLNDPPGLDAAIEAAAQIMFNGANPNGTDWWNAGVLRTEGKRSWRVRAEAVLRAAAPALRAGALREAVDVVRSLRLLVQLHDGPRDQHYEITKPRAWVEARAALAQWDVLRSMADHIDADRIGGAT